MTLSGKARLAGIIGWPVTHSLSPVLHGHWLAEHGIDGAMVPLAARREDFAAVIDGVRKAGFKGVNVTVPHKEAAFAIAHNTDDAQAKISGAANLLIFKDDKIYARNTDAFGFSDSIETSVPSHTYTGKAAVLLGAGGAARAISFALHHPLNISKIFVLNRNVDRARQLAESLSRYIGPKLIAGSLSDWPTVAGEVALAINSTSAGMATNPPLDIDLSFLSKDAIFCDIVYNPLETKLLKDAAALGLRTIDGLGMLMHQAVPSFEAFFGVRPKVTPALREALVKVLRERQL